MERSSEIEELVRRWFAAASSGDTSLALAHVSASEGTRLIGSDPEEVFKGGAAITEFLVSELGSSGGNATFTPNDVEGFCEGTVGWVTTRLEISMRDGKHVSPRWSAVFHREDGTWKFVQTHVSIGIENDKVDWTDPK